MADELTSKPDGDERVSIKVRRQDYLAAQVPTRKLPITFLDTFTAMRLMWEGASDRQRMHFIEQVREAQETASVA